MMISKFARLEFARVRVFSLKKGIQISNRKYVIRRIVITSYSIHYTKLYEDVENIAADFNVPRACRTEAEILSDPEVHAVYIASPVHCHSRQILV